MGTKIMKLPNARRRRTKKPRLSCNSTQVSNNEMGAFLVRELFPQEKGEGYAEGKILSSSWTMLGSQTLRRMERINEQLFRSRDDHNDDDSSRMVIDDDGDDENRVLLTPDDFHRVHGFLILILSRILFEWNELQKKQYVVHENNDCSMMELSSSSSSNEFNNRVVDRDTNEPQTKSGSGIQHWMAVTCQILHKVYYDNSNRCGCELSPGEYRETFDLMLECLNELVHDYSNHNTHKDERISTADDSCVLHVLGILKQLAPKYSNTEVKSRRVYLSLLQTIATIRKERVQCIIVDVLKALIRDGASGGGQSSSSYYGLIALQAAQRAATTFSNCNLVELQDDCCPCCMLDHHRGQRLVDTTEGLFRLHCKLVVAVPSSCVLCKSNSDPSTVVDQLCSMLVHWAGEDGNLNDRESWSSQGAECLSLFLYYLSSNQELSTTPLLGFTYRKVMDVLTGVSSNANTNRRAMNLLLPGLEAASKACLDDWVSDQETGSDSPTIKKLISMLVRYILAPSSEGKDNNICVYNVVSKAAETAAIKLLLRIVDSLLTTSTSLVLHYDLINICIIILDRCDTPALVYRVATFLCQSNLQDVILASCPLALSSIANLLLSLDTPEALKYRILTYLFDLSSCPATSYILAQQTKVLEALVSQASHHQQTEDNQSSSNNNNKSGRTRQTAASILIHLTSHVCNRRILAQQSGLLACLIRFARDYGEKTDDQQQQHDALMSRELVKERIMLVAAVL